MIHRIVNEKMYLEVMNAMKLIDSSLSGGDVLGLFFLEEECKKKIIMKAWSLFKSCVMKKNDLGKFEIFYQAIMVIFC